MTPPSTKAGVIILAIGVNLLEGDIRSSHSKRLTPLKDTRSKSVEIGKISKDLDPLLMDTALQDLSSSSTNLE
jgi:hypothetical protein